jgi:hypothetical protein
MTLDGRVFYHTSATINMQPLEADIHLMEERIRKGKEMIIGKHFPVECERPFSTSNNVKKPQ